LLLCRDGPAAPNGGCLPADVGCCVEDAYTDGGRAGYPCVLPCAGSRWVLPMPGGRVAMSAANDKRSGQTSVTFTRAIVSVRQSHARCYCREIRRGERCRGGRRRVRFAKACLFSVLNTIVRTKRSLLRIRRGIRHDSRVPSDIIARRIRPENDEYGRVVFVLSNRYEMHSLWFCWSSGLQHTLNTTFMLFVEQRPPILRWRSSLDDVAANIRTKRSC